MKNIAFLSVLFLFGLSSPLLAQDKKEPPEVKGNEQEGAQEGDVLPNMASVEFESKLNGPEGFNFDVFTDPDPLPAGGKGKIYFLLNIGEGLFITRGPNETSFNPPPKVGPLKFGKVVWPKPTGTYFHPDLKKYVYGWKGQVFLSADVFVDPKAKYGPFYLKIKHTHRVILENPPKSGVISNEPIDIKVNIGPPLPKVEIPPPGEENSEGKITKSLKPKNKRLNKKNENNKPDKNEVTKEGKILQIKKNNSVNKAETEEVPLESIDYTKGSGFTIFTILLIGGGVFILIGILLLLGYSKK